MQSYSRPPRNERAGACVEYQGILISSYYGHKSTGVTHKAILVSIGTVDQLAEQLILGTLAEQLVLGIKLDTIALLAVVHIKAHCDTILSK